MKRRGLLSVVTTLVTSLAACRGTAPRPVPPTASAAAAPTADPCAAASPAHGASTIRWFVDDAEAARACARATGRPVLIDLWAPWCHTCMSMKHTVLLDAGLQPLAERFVWLAVDTDREVNAALLETLRPEVLPTFVVVTPALQVQARLLGSGSVAQFREFLLNGERGFLDTREGSARVNADNPLHLLREGDRAAMRGDQARARTLYVEALRTAPANWPRRPDVLVSLIGVLVAQEQWARCNELARASMADTGRSSSAADFVAYAAECAGHLEVDAAHSLRLRCRDRLQGLVDDVDAPLSADDRSDALRLLRELHDSLGDATAARATAERQLALLEQAAAGAPDARAASGYNWPRAEVHVYLGRGRELVDALRRSSEALPEDYDPPYRLAWLLVQIGEAEAARAPAERAVELSYGPRRVRTLRLLADVHSARGDVAAERTARDAVLQTLKELPAARRRPGELEQAQADRDALAPPANP
jgi:thioredoxin-like negative regulator of GroEL